MHPMLNTAVKAARAAGNIINRASLELERIQVSRKGPRDYVTDIDQAAEQAIIDVLQTAYPEHGFLAEESGVLPPQQASRRGPSYQWVIDPLDGTTNFIHGYPVYGISLALLQDGQPSHALIFDPSRNELFTASRGGGAFLNNRRIRVSGNARYGESLLGERIGRSGIDATIKKPFQALLEDCGSVRRSGSVALDLAYVAAGRLDGFCGLELKPWDVAAGGLLVLEAGGLIGDFQGEQTWLDTGNVVAATPKIFPRMMARITPG